MQRGDDELTSQRRDLGDEALEIARIELGSGVIEKERRRELGASLKKPKLRECQRYGDELLLSPGEDLACRAPLKAQRDVGPVWPSVRDLPASIASARGGKRLDEGVLLAPPTQVVELDRKTSERRDSLTPVRLKLLNHATPRLRDELTELSELAVPDANVG
ncbi:MAG TPA: hypothetical protein VFK87_06655, partial [Steroidobacteraceae bacterium]|nr:hypothetical protein [Steroidobacteraceae bacterium]